MAGSPTRALQPGLGPIGAAAYLPADPGVVLWGRLPCETDSPVLTIDPGTEVTIDTISHEGVLEDQGRDPVAFFGGFGVERENVLDDAIALAASAHPRDPAVDGQHVVTGPIRVRGAVPGDLLAITVLETLQRVPYGVVSNRHGRGALAGEVALTAMEASLRATLRFDVLSRADALEQFGDQVGPLAETAEFPIPTGLSPDRDEAVQNCVRAAIGLLRARYGMDAAHAYAYLSAATDFNISQVVDLVKGAHARIRKGDFHD